MTALPLHYDETLVVAKLVVVMQYVEAGQSELFLWKPTFIVVVFNSEDSPSGGTGVVDDGFNIQWFDCERVNDPDRDALWKFSSFSYVT